MPVRAIRFFDTHAYLVKAGTETFFVSFEQGFNKDIHVNTMYSWLMLTAITAYKLQTSSISLSTNSRTLQIRSFAASFATLCNFAIAEVMTSCFWASQTTFTVF